MAGDEARCCHFFGIGEAGSAHQGENALGRVVAQQFAGMKKAKAVAGTGDLEIQKIERGAGFEDAADLAQRLFAIVGFEMMKHEGRENRVEAGGWIGKRIGEALIEVDTGI